jgi:hypothetical protein
LDAIPAEGPFYEGMNDVIRWHAETPDDWRSTRQKIHDKYYRYQKGDYKAPVSVVSSLVNGLCGVMAILYGEGDFMKTVGIAVSAGYDCDNQAATCGGLMGVVLGAQAIPPALTQDCLPRGRWDKPFNDTYINFSRDGLPNLQPHLRHRRAHRQHSRNRHPAGRREEVGTGRTDRVCDPAEVAKPAGETSTMNNPG